MEFAVPACVETVLMLQRYVLFIGITLFGFTLAAVSAYCHIFLLFLVVLSEDFCRVIIASSNKASIWREKNV